MKEIQWRFERMRMTLGLLAVLVPGTGAGQGRPSSGADLDGTRVPEWIRPMPVPRNSAARNASLLLTW